MQCKKDLLANHLTKTIDSILLFIIALIFYSYRLAHNPIWFDETLIHLAAQRSVERLFFYSTIGPHPPLYYLLQWVLAGMSHWQTEWAWRWFPMLCAAVTIPLVYILMRRIVSRFSALLSILLLLFAPMQLYFSQEARPYSFLILLSTISIFQLTRVQNNPDRKSEWIRLGLISIVGLYTSYSYSFLIAGQLFYLALILGQWRRGIITGFLVVLVAGLPLLRSATPTLNFILDKNVDNPSLTFGRMLQSLFVLEPLRYGFYWAHDWMPVIFGLLLVIALWQIMETEFFRGNFVSNTLKPNVYHLIQVILPPLVFFTICTPLLDIKLPLRDSKQFILLFPSVFILIAIALDTFGQIRPRAIGVILSLAICGLIFVSDAQGISRYWEMTKSPEGLAIRQLQADLQPDDGIIVFHYSPAALVSFYMPDQPFYIPPRRGDRTKNEFQIYLDGDWENEPRPLAEILTQHPRFWVFHFHPLLETTQAHLKDACVLDRERAYGPFTSLLYSCQ